MFLLLYCVLPAVFAENLVLYHPVHPEFPVPLSEQNFDKNAPPRIFSKDPSAPSTGIVYLKALRHPAPKLDDMGSKDGFKVHEAVIVYPKGASSSSFIPLPVDEMKPFARLPTDDVEFVDVVSDIDYSAYDIAKEKSNKLYDDNSATLPTLRTPIKLPIFSEGSAASSRSRGASLSQLGEVLEHGSPRHIEPTKDATKVIILPGSQQRLYGRPINDNRISRRANLDTRYSSKTYAPRLVNFGDTKEKPEGTKLFSEILFRPRVRLSLSH